MKLTKANIATSSPRMRGVFVRLRLYGSRATVVWHHVQESMIRTGLFAR